MTKLFLLTVFAAALPAAAQSVGDTLRDPAKSVPAVNQTMEGTWMYELRRGGQAAGQPPVLLLIQFYEGGAITAAAGDGSQSSHHGIWLRVGDRRFLITTFLWNFNENRTLTGITKVRANVQVSEDGRTARGTQEIVVLDPTGKTLATIPGGTFTGVRLTQEIPGDFESFQ
jgi:hypothetical protein